MSTPSPGPLQVLREARERVDSFLADICRTYDDGVQRSHSARHRLAASVQNSIIEQLSQRLPAPQRTHRPVAAFASIFGSQKGEIQGSKQDGAVEKDWLGRPKRSKDVLAAQPAQDEPCAPHATSHVSDRLAHVVPIYRDALLRHARTLAVHAQSALWPPQQSACPATNIQRHAVAAAHAHTPAHAAQGARTRDC
jgi:hypothetical protein